MDEYVCTQCDRGPCKDTDGPTCPTEPCYIRVGDRNLRDNKAADEVEMGMKFDGQGKDGKPLKPRWSLLPWREVREVVEILTEGCTKYSEFNWQKVKPTSRYTDAMMRHIEAWISGEKIDESGHSHLAHATCNLLFLMWFDNERS